MAEKNVDDLIRLRREKQLELQKIGKEIKESGEHIIVAFVDLANSTELKARLQPDEWLGYVYAFLQAAHGHACSSGGTVVKRIGDELMLSFREGTNAEKFLNSLESEPMLPPESYKAVLDCGEAYHFKFTEHFERDPYGSFVDRCARIAKLAKPGAILCSGDYARETRSPRYVFAGKFPMKGFAEPQEVFIRQPGADPVYLQPLLRSLNEESEKRLASYTALPRVATPDYLTTLGEGKVRPFLARCLLNVPRLAFSAKELSNWLSTPEGKANEGRFNGHFIEWRVVFEEYQVEKGRIRVSATIENASFVDSAWINLVPAMLETVQTLSKGQRLLVRGILMEVFSIHAIINYADLEML
jgi:class 3 adenylate cyclase